MLLASARDAKAELLAALAAPEARYGGAGALGRGLAADAAGRRRHRAHFGIDGRPAGLPDEPVAEARPAVDVAVGVALIRGQRFGVAVRVADADGLALPAVRALVDAGGTEVDVRVVGEVTAQTGPGAGRPPLRPGASVAHPRATTGTLGCFVATPQGPGFVSCWHVLGGVGAQPGDALLAPGPADGGAASDRVGTLLATVPLQVDGVNAADVAVGLLDDPARAAPNAVTGGRLRGVLDPAALGELVAGRRGPLRVGKTGRTTGTTRGRVTAVEVDGVRVGYGAAGRFAFDDCVEVAGEGAPFSRPGDSGSVVHTLDRRLAVGLLFCGSATGGPGGHGVSYASGITTALGLVGATLLT